MGRSLGLALGLVVCLPESAQAAALPTIIPFGIMMIWAVLPIIGVEACVLWARLGVEFGESLWISGVANIVSTIVGVPAASFLGAYIARGSTMWYGTMSWKSGRLAESDSLWKRVLSFVMGSLGIVGERNSSWVIFSVFLVLLVPFFFLSCFVELLIAGTMLEEAGSALLLGSVFLANLASHSLLVLLLLFALREGLGKFREKLREELEARVPRLVDAGLAPDGRIFAADERGTLRFFDADSGQQVLAQDPIREELSCRAVSSDSRFAFAVGVDNRVVWEHTTKREVCRLDEDGYDFQGGAVFSPNGEFLAAVSVADDLVFRIWSCDTGRVVSSFNAPWEWGDSGEFFDLNIHVVFSPATPIVAVGTAWQQTAEGEVVYLLDRESCNCVHTIDARSSIEKIAFSPDGRYLAVAKRSDLISVYDSETWTPIRSLEAVPMEDMMVTAISDLAFNPNSAQLAVASSDGKVRLMNVDTGKCDSETRITHKGSFFLAFTPDCGQLIAVGEPESIIRLPLKDGRFVALRQQ